MSDGSKFSKVMPNVHVADMRIQILLYLSDGSKLGYA